MDALARAEIGERHMANKRRLNLVVPERAVERLDWLQTKTDAASHTEVIRQALFAYEQLVAKVADGSTLMEKTQRGDLLPLAISIDVKAPPKPELKVAS